uniref:NOB1_Zn_bind domain-containing protein n=1 Tax=Mesocestoides corti TaxID=53468 RepID=A0A5K3FNS6_MESCO
MHHRQCLLFQNCTFTVLITSLPWRQDVIRGHGLSFSAACAQLLPVATGCWQLCRPDVSRSRVSLVVEQTVDDFRRKRGRGQPRQAFVTVDDLKTPSTDEIAIPTGTKRTGWGSEAPAAKKAQIAEVLATTSVQEGVSNAEAEAILASKRMSDRGRRQRKAVRGGFKRAYDKRESDKRDEDSHRVGFRVSKHKSRSRKACAK